MSKPKVIVSFSKDRTTDAAIVAKALTSRYGTFEVVTGVPGTFTFTFTIDFTGEKTTIVADGSWNLPGNQRPAWGTMATFAEGYAQALVDRDAQELPTKPE